MRKGLYSSTIALTALVLAIAIIATANQGMAIQEETIYSKATMEVKTQWQNARFVLDKAASDAIADSTLANSCRYDEDGAHNTTFNYFRSILHEMWNNECNLTEFELSGAASDIQIDLTIECVKYFGEEFSATYEKAAVFNKSVTTALPCTIIVTDEQSGIEEARYPLAVP